MNEDMLSKEEIIKKIKSIDEDIRELTESSISAYVNEGIINQVRIRINELIDEKDRLSTLL